MNRQHWKTGGDIRYPFDCLLIESYLQLLFAAPDAHRRQRIPSLVQTRKQFKKTGLMIYQIGDLLGAKRAHMAEVVNRLQQAGFAGGVLAAYQVDAAAGVKFNLLQISELLYV